MYLPLQVSSSMRIGARPIIKATPVWQERNTVLDLPIRARYRGFCMSFVAQNVEFPLGPIPKCHPHALDRESLLRPCRAVDKCKALWVIEFLQALPSGTAIPASVGSWRR